MDRKKGKQNSNVCQGIETVFLNYGGKDKDTKFNPQSLYLGICTKSKFFLTLHKTDCLHTEYEHDMALNL